LTNENKENIMMFIFSDVAQETFMPSKPNTIAAAPAEHRKDSALPQRILKAFEGQARLVGPRRVIISELVSELGISSKTLYRHFDNKEQIVYELMTTWSEHWLSLQQRGFSDGLGPKQRIETIAVNWVEHIGRFSEQFWLQLERDFPEAFKVYQQQYHAFLERSRQNLVAHIRKDLNPDLALSTLMSMINHVTNSQLHDQLNLTRKDALLQVIDLWAQGAFRQELQR